MRVEEIFYFETVSYVELLSHKIVLNFFTKKDKLKKVLPQELVSSVEIFRTYYEEELDVIVHFNVFGEVLKFENDYFDLPEAAKKLAYGNNPTSKIRALNIFTEDLKIILPMLAHGLTDEMLIPSWLIPVQVALEKMKSQPITSAIGSIEDYVEDEWTKQLYQSLDKEIYGRFFPFFVNEEKNRESRFKDVFTNLVGEKNKTLRADLKLGKEYANLFFVFTLLKMADRDAVGRIIKQIDTTASEALVDISVILNKELFMAKRQENDLIQNLLKAIDFEGIKNSLTNTYTKNFKEPFSIKDPVLLGMLKAYILKMQGGTILKKSKMKMNDIFRDFYNVFKPY